MTIIAAKKYYGHWAMFADDGVTIGTVHTNTKSYRPKIRKLVGKNTTLYVGGCGTIKDIDYTVNCIEQMLATTKIKNKLDLKIELQKAISGAYNALKQIANDPSVALVILEPDTDTLFTSDSYSLTEILEDDVELAFGSADTAFYKAKSAVWFFNALKLSVLCDEYCDYPIKYIHNNVWWEITATEAFNGNFTIDTKLQWNTEETDKKKKE